MWRGEADIEGKTILVDMDEGIGEAIQLACYVPMLSACGARAILVVGDPVCPLLSTLPDVSECLPNLFSRYRRMFARLRLSCLLCSTRRRTFAGVPWSLPTLHWRFNAASTSKSPRSNIASLLNDRGPLSERTLSFARCCFSSVETSSARHT
jgi:hypothetical protein